MRNPLADKVVDIKPSGIRKFFDIVSEMQDAISLGVGEPDFDTPWHIRDEGIYSLEKGRTFYTSNAGLKDLRQEICNTIQRKQGVTYDWQHEVLVTVGGSEAIDIGLRAMCNPGDEVLIPQPSYVSYEPCAVLAGATPVIIDLKAENEFRLTAEELEAAITDKTKVLILPFPNNPTGAIMEKSDLEAIAKVIEEHDIFVMSDEIYSELTYKEKHVSIVSLPGMKERTIYINGFSKAYAMTGWRLGYCCGPAAIIQQMTKIHQFAIMCAPTTSQYAAVEALKNGDPDIEEMRTAYNQRRRFLMNAFREYINGMEVVKVFNKDADSYERFRKDVSDYRDYTLAWYKAAWPWMAIYSSLLPCTIILTLPVGAWFVLSGWSTLPNLILVLCLSLSIGMPLLKSLGFLPTMPQLNYKISALEQVLDAPELQQTEDAFHGKDDTITYDHVSFAYQTTQPGPDGKPVVIEDEVLHDISFTAKAGQKTALVGESGSGKSTLAKLLIHYYDPQKGSISIGGQKLCDMSLEALNSRISYVAQDQYLFNTSLLENIRLGRLNATDEEVVEAAKKAQCIEFLEKLPQGIHSMAGDAGKMLSGGQRQRISLARAILKDAPIVVLDEATAYADPENEEKMEAAIAELVKGKTLVVIAHKLPAIMNADQICVMDHGKLVATGRHQELIQSCPEYQKLWKAAQDSAEWKVHTAKEGK